MSSPSRQVIDPLICSYSENAERRPRMPLLLLGNNVHAPAGKTAPQHQNQASSWTPLVTRTLSTELGLLNSTPSLKLFNLCRNGGYTDNTDFGLNLTPFLTHNMNLLAHPVSSGAISGPGTFTPYYDKSMHMADFFMDSPIRVSPGKLDAITPLRFDLSEENKREHKLNPSLSVKKRVQQPKRSITQLDTPARHHAKKNGAVGIKLEPAFDSENDENDENINKAVEAHFATPSKRKILRETPSTALNKTPMKTPLQDKPQFRTPAGKCPVSSPSTVIMSSAVKLPAALGSKAPQPPTPTPHKDGLFVEPVMGIFSENKGLKTGENDTSKKLVRQKLGTNKFQIVFTDVHTLMNGKKKKGTSGAKGEKKPEKKKSKGKLAAPQNGFGQYLDHGSFGQADGSFGSHGSHVNTFGGLHPTLSFSVPHEFNTSMTSSKEFSMTHNSTVNTSSGNMTSADHASFDMMHGGIMLTPNGKFLLDTLFEKASPGVAHQKSASRYLNMHGDKDMHVAHEMPNHREYMPPPKLFSLQQAAQAALREKLHELHHDHHLQYHLQALFQSKPPNNVLMSTPQHDHVHGFANYTQAESSPTENHSIQMLYLQLHPKQGGSSPNEAPSKTSKTTSAVTKKAPKRKQKKR